MKELCLNVLDIAQNSIVAKASLIALYVHEDTARDKLTITLRDNGCGMTEEQIKNVTDPFYTTRTTRKIGLGVPLFKMAAEMSDGDFSITSKNGEGTDVTATFLLSHVDRMPLGDMEGTMADLIYMNPELDFVYKRTRDERELNLDTRELKEILGDVPLNSPDVRVWLKEYLAEQLSELLEIGG